MLEIAVIQFIAGVQMMMKALNFSKFAQLWNHIREHSFDVIGQFANQADNPLGLLGLLGVGVLALSVISLAGVLSSSKALKRLSLALTFGVLIFSAVYWRADLTEYIRKTLSDVQLTGSWLGMMAGHL